MKETWEKMYNEALKRAKAAIDVAADKDLVKGVASTIFPELRESEDERMVKNIRLALLSVDDAFWATHSLTAKEAIAWLEKQKENPKNADSIPSDCVSDAKCEDRWHKTANSLPDNGRDVLAKDALGNCLLASFDRAQWFVSVYDGEDHPVLHTPPIHEWCDIPSGTQKEQKPVDNTCGTCCDDERFEIIAQAKKDIIEKTNITENELSMELPLLDGILLRVWQVGWLNRKPAEWSEEDRHAIENCEYAIKETFKGEQNPHRIETLDWLKVLSLNRKMINEGVEKLCSNEWSEEEAKKAAEDYADEYPGMTHENDGSTIEDYDKPYNDFMAGVLWAKHHGIFQNGNTHWKPSEEQMYALARAVTLYDNKLDSLYQDLKKLRKK